MAFDVVIRGGTVLDGRGGEAAGVDVGVAGERIEALDPSLAAAEAERVLDATGLVVAPGFIDIHAHGDVFPLACPEAPARLHDGVTTEILGNCGESPFPQSQAMLAARADSVERHGIVVDWATLDDYAARHDAARCGIHRGSLVGHSNVRQAVMGEVDRPPSDAELAAMRREVEQAMEAGAFGLSSGLIYAPGMYARPQEIEALCRVVARRGGLYASHIRSEGEAVEAALGEFLDAGRRTGVRLQHSHAKVSGFANWGKADLAMGLIEAARAEGIDVACDRYPYTASWTSLAAFLPGWAREGGREMLAARLVDARDRPRLLAWLNGPEGPERWTALVVASARAPAWAWTEGRSLAEVAEERGEEPAAAALELLTASGGRASVMLFAMSEENLARWLRRPYVAIGSDSSSRGAQGVTAEGKPHPRSFGTSARFLGRYVRDQGLMSLTEGVRRLTGLPAQRLGLRRRGVLEPGAFADITVFDPRRIEDRATYRDPQQYSAGVRHVLVGGALALSDGELTGVRNGRFLRRGQE
ncbi:MAG: N-acyl-D-amino-acid deacylase family protein [bacterium]